MKTTVLISGVALVIVVIALAVQGFRVREGFQDADTLVQSASADTSIAKTTTANAKRLNSTLAQIVADTLGTTLDRGSDQQFGLENAIAPALAASSDVATSVGAARDAFTTTPSMETFDTQSKALRAADPKTQDSTQNTLQQQDITNGLILPGRLNCPELKPRACPRCDCPNYQCSCPKCDVPACPKCRDMSAEIQKAVKEAQAAAETSKKAEKKEAAKKRVVELTTRLKKAKENQDSAKRTQDALKNKTTPEARAILTSLNQQRDTQLQQFDEQKVANTEATAQGFQNQSPKSSFDRFFNAGRASAESSME